MIRFYVIVGMILILTGCSPKDNATYSIIHTDIEITVNPANVKFHGKSMIKVSGNGQIRIPISNRLKFVKFSVSDGSHQRECSIINKEADESQEIAIRLMQTDTLLEFNYWSELEKTSPKGNANFSHHELSNQAIISVQSDGVFLNPEADWYPHTNTLSTHSVKLNLPETWYGECSGKLIKNEVKENRRQLQFVAKTPTEPFFVMAAPFKVYSVKQQEASPEVRALLLNEDSKLSTTYMQMSQQYLSHYSKKIGPYPYERFDVVENYYQTGYGMPGYTVLGSQVMRLPFIPYTSLGHEVLHNWWGNGVFVKYSAGNWCEGLTNYMADYYMARRKGNEPAFQFRYEIIKELSNIADKGKLFPLKDFKERSDRISRVIGYGKSAMVFHYLHMLSGEDKFLGTARLFYKRFCFKRAAWEDFFNVFDEVTSLQQRDNLMRWINFEDLPRLSITGLQKRQIKNKGYSLNFQIHQENHLPLWNIFVPVRAYFSDSTFLDTLVFLQNRNQGVQLLAPKPIRQIALDPEMQLLRYLDDSLRTSTFSDLFDGNQMQVYHGINLPDTILQGLQVAFNSRWINATSLTEKAIQVYVGHEIPKDLRKEIHKTSPEIFAGLANLAEDQWGIGTVKLSGLTYLIIIVPQFEKWIDVIGKIKHYGRYSFLKWRNNKVVDKYVGILSKNRLIQQIHSQTDH